MYQIDPATGDLIISGFEKGIGDSPYSGLTDMKSVNPSTIPGEVSVSFKSSSLIQTYSTSAVLTVDGSGNLVFTTSGAQGKFLENGQSFYVTASSISGLSSGTNVYWVASAGNQGGGIEKFSVATTYGTTTTLVLGNTGTAAIVTFNLSLPKQLTKSRGNNFVIDDKGQVWSDMVTTSGGTSINSTSSWTYTGNLANNGTSPDTSANGNGILVYQTVTNGTGGTGTSGGVDEWLFVWRNSQIDYTKITANGSSISPLVAWKYGWKPSLGTLGNTQYLQTNATINNSHQGLVTPDARVNYIDANYIGNFYQNIPVPGSNYVGFDPTNTTTYTFANITAVVPYNEISTCVAFVNQYLLVGTNSNKIYPWDLSPAHNTYSTPIILLPELNVANIVTVGNNAYIFAGNRGNIYITNGSQASFFKKVPDHISNSIEPLFTWGGATYNKNRLYFGCNINLQSGGTGTGYGGIWCIDLTSGALFNAQQMSYGSYAGYVNTLMVSTAQSAYSPSIGYGLLAGWTDGLGGYGIDGDVATPYTGGQSYIISDLIPIGTNLQPTTSSQIEFKLSTPLLTGETVELQVGSSLTGSFTSALTTNGDGILLSGNSNSFPIQTQQWMLIKAILTGKSSSPSYNRLTEIRLIGGTQQYTPQKSGYVVS